MSPGILQQPLPPTPFAVMQATICSLAWMYNSISLVFYTLKSNCSHHNASHATQLFCFNENCFGIIMIYIINNNFVSKRMPSGYYALIG